MTIKKGRRLSEELANRKIQRQLFPDPEQSLHKNGFSLGFKEDEAEGEGNEDPPIVSNDYIYP